MTSPKTRVGLLCGGKSAEHEVSLQSAKNVVDAIDKNKYEIVLIAIDKDGQWHHHDATDFLLNADDPGRIRLKPCHNPVVLVPGQREKQLVNLTAPDKSQTLDVIFPILHGPLGEDGTIQGLLKLCGIPFVGAGVMGSAVGMDKAVMKRLLRDAGLPSAPFLTFTNATRHEIEWAPIVAELGLPLFVKPANMGSSVGVSMVRNETTFQQAIETAFRFDWKIIIEQYVKGRELECAVLGNLEPKASQVGEVIAHHDFYSYEAKYIDDNGARLDIPAHLPEDVVPKIQRIAVETCRVLGCEGMARVDVFLTESGKILVNEINTIPGFTRISMYPKLWEISGVSYSALIDRLLQLALERDQRERALSSTYAEAAT